MRNSRRNIQDPISPQNPVIQKDVIENDRIQDHLVDKTAVEDIYKPENDEPKTEPDNKPFKGSNDTNLEDES